MPIDLHKLKNLLKGTDIEVFEVIDHGKASESYIDVEFTIFQWRGYIPFHYRRTGLFIETEEALVSYLLDIKSKFAPQATRQWIKSEKKWWNSEMHGRYVTKPFFDELAKLKWTNSFPSNNNPQRRIQDIKELGYTIATKRVGRETFRLLLPLPRTSETGYENLSPSFKKKALKVLNRLNIYELSSAYSKALIPDHKFPEIRWDAETRAENPDNMPDSEIAKKFQLLDNQRNQQKREVCRQCFQTGKRGVLYGIKFFYAGDENWPIEIPKVGKSAEKGCVGCGWYDIEEWRRILNELINRPSAKKLP